MTPRALFRTNDATVASYNLDETMPSLTASAEDRGGEDEQASDAVQQSLSDPEVPARPQAPLPVMETNLATSPPPEQQPRRLPQDQGQQHNNASLSLEELKAQERKQIITFISVLLVVLLVMIIVVTGVVVGLHHKHRSNKSNAASSATAAPTPVPYTSDGRYQCFTGVDELKLAILYYRLDPTNQTLADMYGTPIGAWCTRPMKSLRDLLQGITTFNYDISGWDVSNVEDMVRGREREGIDGCFGLQPKPSIHVFLPSNLCPGSIYASSGRAFCLRELSTLISH
jgi:hypothetical protein